MRTARHSVAMLQRLTSTAWLRDFVFCLLVCVAGLSLCALAAASAG